MIKESDFLVIGTGIAGLSFALRLAEKGTVHLVTKKISWESNTNYAQGGIASVFGNDDSFADHIRDTLITGSGLSHTEIVEEVVTQAPDRIRDLIRWGVDFDQNDDSELVLGREGGHSHNRIVHVKDLTGRSVENMLLERVREHPNIELFADHQALDLITEHHTGEESGEVLNCYGAYVLDKSDGTIHRFLASLTMLASGGTGQVYQHSTNPSIATGDGLAMAYRAGATLVNLEFMQFHPTTLYLPEGRRERAFLISEALRGHGAVIRDWEGDEFIKHPQGSLAPRDVVARSIDERMKTRGRPYMYLDATAIPAADLRASFPHIHRKCLEQGIDITQQMIPIVPAAHYMCGGVQTDLSGRTEIRGLMASGEVGHTGLHGANRLASNSLLEALVISHQAAHAVDDFRVDLSIHRDSIPPWDASGTYDSEEWILIQHNRLEIQMLMWDYVGIVRSRLRLERAQRRIRLIGEEIEAYYNKTRVSGGLVELRNLVAVAHLIIKAALKRNESRGLHYRKDFPDTDDKNWQHDTLIRRRDASD